MPDYTTLSFEVADGVAAVIFDSPPLNLVSHTMIEELNQLFEQLREDDRVRVVTFDSANSDFFMGHADLHLFLDAKDTVPPKANRLNPLQSLLETLRTLPKATISMLAGLIHRSYEF